MYYLLRHCASCKIPKKIPTVPWSKGVFNNWFGTNKSISNDLFVKFHSFYEWICSRLIFLQIQDKHENYWQTSPCIWGYGHVTSTYDDNILEVLLVVFRADFFHSARLEWHNFWPWENLAGPKSYILILATFLKVTSNVTFKKWF